MPDPVTAAGSHAHGQNWPIFSGITIPPPVRERGSCYKPPTQFILNMNADDIFERVLRHKPKLTRAARVEAAWPAGDDALDRRVGLAADAVDRVVARDLAQGLDLPGNRRGDAWHGQVAPSPKPRGVHRGGVDQEADSRAG